MELNDVAAAADECTWSDVPSEWCGGANAANAAIEVSLEDADGAGTDDIGDAVLCELSWPDTPQRLLLFLGGGSVVAAADSDDDGGACDGVQSVLWPCSTSTGCCGLTAPSDSSHTLAL